MHKHTQYIVQRSKAFWVLTLFTACMVLATPSHAQSVNINCINPLIFGEIIPCGSAGTLVIRPDGSAVASCVFQGSAPTSNALCSITQSFPFRPMDVVVTTPSISITSGANSMTVNNFNLITNGGGDSVSLPAQPFVEVPIGATMNVGATQASGSYSGNFTVEVTLQ